MFNRGALTLLLFFIFMGISIVLADSFQDNEPASSMVSNNAVARLSDGRILLIMPAPENRSLYISRDDNPITLDDFQPPLLLFGEEGLLTSGVPDQIGMGVIQDTVHIVSTSQHRLDWYRTPAPITAGSEWEHVHIDTQGRVMLEDVVYETNRISVLYSEQSADSTRWRVGMALFGEGGIQMREIAESTDILHSARGSWNSSGVMDMIWSQSLLAPQIQHTHIDPEAAGGSKVRFVTEGMHPDFIVVKDVMFIASTQNDGSIQVKRLTPDGSVHTYRVEGRSTYRPTLCVDDHDMVWLFAVDFDQRGLYYRRFLGSAFSDEYQCGGAPGASKLSVGYAVQPKVESNQYGFAILRGTYLDVNYQYWFGHLPVPRYSVNDDRHVMFLDMMEVSEMENLQQIVTTAVKSETNPVKLTGPPGSPDEAWSQYATVLHENDKFRIWYGTDDYDYGWNWNLAYAESDDGINWIKPELGIVEYNGSKKNNLLIPNMSGSGQYSGANAVGSLVMRDDAEKDPERRYKMAFESKPATARYAVYLAWSADGIHWQMPPHRLWGRSPGKNQNIEAWHPWPEPLLSFFYDPITPHPDYRYKIYGQNPHAAFPDLDISRPRNLSLVYGPTPYDFTPYEGNPVLDPRTGIDEDQIHGGLVQPYHGLYICLYQHWFDKNWLCDLRLAVSRDGIHFARVNPGHAILPLGPPGSWDSGMLCTPTSVFEHEEKIWLYYRGSIGTLATGRALRRAGNDSPYIRSLGEAFRRYTGLARLRIEGFAFLTLKDMEYLPQKKHNQNRPEYEVKLEGRVQTIPVDANGIGDRSLHVNLINFAPGFAWIKAQLIDADSGDIIPGYSLEDCDRINESDIDRTVTWNGVADLNKVQAKNIRVEFQLFGNLDSPQLYSFWFDDLNVGGESSGSK